METVRVGAEQLRRQLTDLLNRVGYGGEQIVIERNGRPIAVLSPYKARQADWNEVEQAPALAQELEAARLTAGVSYEVLAEQLQAERLRTLREKYPDFMLETADDKPTHQPG